MAKRPQEGDCEERVVAKSKPVRNLVSKSRAGISTVPSSMASSSVGNFRPEGHEVSLNASTGESVALNQETDLTKCDAMTDSQVRHSGASSMASTGQPVGWS